MATDVTTLSLKLKILSISSLRTQMNEWEISCVWTHRISTNGMENETEWFIATTAAATELKLCVVFIVSISLPISRVRKRAKDEWLRRIVLPGIISTKAINKRHTNDDKSRLVFLRFVFHSSSGLFHFRVKSTTNRVLCALSLPLSLTRVRVCVYISVMGSHLKRVWKRPQSRLL